ncbi:NUDIX domain-containing protein [Akkermansiaceae bacterium]|nr:NUDIX domain-containing protein [Akkermansiaceae bacterium]
MSKYAGEEVLVVKRGLLEGLGMFEGLRTERVDDAVEALLDAENHFFMDRAAAEEDPGHKQLIPYCIFRCGDRVLYYTRGKSGGESRLHAKISVGVGGHINPVDMGEGRQGAAAYYAAVQREIDEELDIACDYSMSVVGLLNDDSNPVGQVHLGVVHLVELEGEEVFSREEALANLSWASVSELNGELADRLETWSAFCVDWLAAQATEKR